MRWYLFYVLYILPTSPHLPMCGHVGSENSTYVKCHETTNKKIQSVPNKKCVTSKGFEKSN